jgi:ATP-dependent Clp protease ATP-binding subunit ClpC
VKKDDVTDAEKAWGETKGKLMEQLKRLFRPEFLNRVDGTVVFRPLTREEIGQIVTLELNKVQKRLADHNVSIETTAAAKDYLATKGYDPDYGARPLRRVIQNEVEDALSDALLSGKLKANGTVVIDYIEVDGAKRLDFAMKEGAAGAEIAVTPIEAVKSSEPGKPDGEVMEPVLS